MDDRMGRMRALPQEAARGRPNAPSGPHHPPSPSITQSMSVFLRASLKDVMQVSAVTVEPVFTVGARRRSGLGPASLAAPTASRAALAAACAQLLASGISNKLQCC